MKIHNKLTTGKKSEGLFGEMGFNKESGKRLERCKACEEDYEQRVTLRSIYRLKFEKEKFALVTLSALFTSEEARSQYPNIVSTWIGLLGPELQLDASEP